MKLIKFFSSIFCVLLIVYLIFSVANGTFDFGVWSEGARTGFAVVGTGATIVTIVLAGMEL
jgi:hypothetical protein